MLYYELNITTNNKLIDEIVKKCSVEGVKEDKTREILCRLNEEVQSRFDENENKILYFSYCGEGEITAVAGYKAECSSNIKDDVVSILDKFTQQKVDIKIKEITVNHFENKMDMISDMGYAKMNMSTFNRRYKLNYRNNRAFSVSQSLVPEEKLTYNDAVEKAEELMTSNDFKDELKRIYSDKHPKEFLGHPVHYKISAGEIESAFEHINLLVHALYSNGRLRGRRIDYISKITQFCYDEDDMVNLFYNADGGTVVIELVQDKSDENSYASAYEDVIDFLSSLIHEYYQNVLIVIIELTRMQAISKKLVSRIADEIDLIHISEGVESVEYAKKYMDYLVKNSSLSDYEPKNIIFDKEKYKASDVHKMFKSWIKSSLKDCVYTEYAAKQIKCVENESVRSDAYNRLQNMIGLDEVKEVIDNIIAAYTMQKLKSGYQQKECIASKHMIFTGNPGSAKTTVARLVAEILKNEGVLETGEFVECGRADLVGKYVGWTAKQVRAKFDEAYGGILFIDEAYSLVDDTGSFGDEAINTIVQEMENRRDGVIVIFAGYPDKMKDFIAKNEGLKSRIAFHVDFPDYNADELFGIMKLMLEENEYTMTADAEKEAKKIFDAVQYIENFGNGRFVRNVLEAAQMRQSLRLMKSGFTNADDKETLFRLKKDDFNLPSVVPQKEVSRKIGFGL